MRLVNTTESDSGSFNIEEFTDYNTPPYAILSHTWEQEEVSLQDMQGNGAKTKKGFDKIKRCCALALASGFNYVWIDTCCIDKASSAELSEAINSMYRWYEEADICYAYLADVPSKRELKKSKWFTRGWTLQELIAPADLMFLDEEWKKLGNKKDLDFQRILYECTHVPIGILSGKDDLDIFSVAQKMSWAAKRETTRVEDRAYSLMGLFGVNMPLIYGERETSFIRLQEEIMRTSDDHTLFAWQHDDNRAGLLATSPAAFADSYNVIRSNPFGSFGNAPTVSSRGIHLELHFLGIDRRGIGLAILHCKEQTDQGNLRLIAIYVKDLSLTMELFMRVESHTLEKVVLKKFRPSQYPVRKICIQVSHITRKKRQIQENWDPDARIRMDSRRCDDLSKLMDFENPAALPQAAKRGDDGVVWLLLTRSDVEIEVKDTFGLGLTALSSAAVYGHEGIVKMLLQAGALIDGDGHGGTPLSRAAANQHHGIMKILLEKGAAVKNDETFDRMLSWAVTSGYEAIIESLLSWGFAIDDAIFQANIWRAAVNGHENVFDLLLEKYAEPDAGRLDLLLLCAASEGLEYKVKLLLERDIGLKASDEAHQTPLHRAALRGHEAIAKMLLERGFDLEAKDEHSRTPLHFAVEGGKTMVVELLLGRGADLAATDNFRQTPLHYAARYGRERIAKLLLERGANLEAKAKFSHTPLHIAVTWGKEPTVEVLLDRGADLEAECDRLAYRGPDTVPTIWNHFETPLNLAALYGHKRILTMLFERGAEVDARIDAEDIRDGWMPLSQRVKHSHPEIAELFFGSEDQNHRPLLQKKIGKGGQFLAKLRHFNRFS